MFHRDIKKVIKQTPTSQNARSQALRAKFQDPQEENTSGRGGDAPSGVSANPEQKSTPFSFNFDLSPDVSATPSLSAAAEALAQVDRASTRFVVKLRPKPAGAGTVAAGATGVPSAAGAAGAAGTAEAPAAGPGKAPVLATPSTSQRVASGTVVRPAPRNHPVILNPDCMRRYNSLYLHRDLEVITTVDNFIESAAPGCYVWQLSELPTRQVDLSMQSRGKGGKGKGGKGKHKKPSSPNVPETIVVVDEDRLPEFPPWIAGVDIFRPEEFGYGANHRGEVELPDFSVDPKSGLLTLINPDASPKSCYITLTHPYRFVDAEGSMLPPTYAAYYQDPLAAAVSSIAGTDSRQSTTTSGSEKDRSMLRVTFATTLVVTMPPRCVIDCCTILRASANSAQDQLKFAGVTALNQMLASSNKLNSVIPAGDPDLEVWTDILERLTPIDKLPMIALLQGSLDLRLLQECLFSNVTPMSVPLQPPLDTIEVDAEGEFDADAVKRGERKTELADMLAEFKDDLVAAEVIKPISEIESTLNQIAGSVDGKVDKQDVVERNLEALQLIASEIPKSVMAPPQPKPAISVAKLPLRQKKMAETKPKQATAHSQGTKKLSEESSPSKVPEAPEESPTSDGADSKLSGTALAAAAAAVAAATTSDVSSKSAGKSSEAAENLPPIPCFPLPLMPPGPYLCTQGCGGCLTHFVPETRHAIDIRCAPGTPVLAVADGVVVSTSHSSHAQGAHVNNLFTWNSLMIRIEPSDIPYLMKSTADKSDQATTQFHSPVFVEYVHIQANSSFVRVGERVKKGQIIALSGRAGFCPEPHLHVQAVLSQAEDAKTIPFMLIADSRYDAKATHKGPFAYLPSAGLFLTDIGALKPPHAAKLLHTARTVFQYFLEHYLSKRRDSAALMALMTDETKVTLANMALSKPKKGDQKKPEQPAYTLFDLSSQPYYASDLWPYPALRPGLTDPKARVPFFKYFPTAQDRKRHVDNVLDAFELDGSNDTPTQTDPENESKGEVDACSPQCFFPFWFAQLVMSYALEDDEEDDKPRPTFESSVPAKNTTSAATGK